LSLTQETVAEFSKIVEIISLMKDADAALELHRWFGQVFDKYDLPETFSGRFSGADHDYFKFLGHELFVTFIGFLLREQCWDILESVLAEPIPVRYLRRLHGPGNVDRRFASEHLFLLLDESTRRRRVSLHADILNERHTKEGLAAIMPMEDFMAADYFLFLLGEMSLDTAGESIIEWRPWSALYLKRPPRFLLNAERQRTAHHLMKLFHITSVDQFRAQLAERTPGLRRLFPTGFWNSPLGAEDINRVGTR
jgi:hypothetical protein